MGAEPVGAGEVGDQLVDGEVIDPRGSGVAEEGAEVGVTEPEILGPGPPAVAQAQGGRSGIIDPWLLRVPGDQGRHLGRPGRAGAGSGHVAFDLRSPGGERLQHHGRDAGQLGGPVDHGAEPDTEPLDQS